MNKITAEIITLLFFRWSQLLLLYSHIIHFSHDSKFFKIWIQLRHLLLTSSPFKLCSCLFGQSFFLTELSRKITLFSASTILWVLSSCSSFSSSFIFASANCSRTLFNSSCTSFPLVSVSFWNAALLQLDFNFLAAAS